MATTAGTTRPIVPVGGSSQRAAEVMELPVATSQTIVAGDILVFSGGLVSVDNTFAATDKVIGVAAEDYTSGTSVSHNTDKVKFHPAKPGVLFEGNAVNGTTDLTGTFASDLGLQVGFIESADGFACVDVSSGTLEAVTTLRYGGPNKNDTETGYDAGVGIVNPRVIFTFMASIWGVTNISTD